MQVTQSLAIRVRDTSILNSNELAGRRRLEVTYEGRVVALEFALFAVSS